MPRCLVVQHVPPEGPYAVGSALRSAGVDLEICRTFAGDRVPTQLDGWDGLVVMGGPMSAASDDGFPTRRREVDLLASAITAGTPTLGVCLGAQLLAVAAGADVYPGPVGPEIGWGTVALSAEAQSDHLLGGLPATLSVLHWHGDTFDLPPGSVRLATNSTYANQAFRLGDRAWGIQFHAEVDRSAVDAFVDAFASEATAAGVDPQVISAEAPASLTRVAEPRRLITTRFADLVATSRPAAWAEPSIDRVAPSVAL
jgi:GMP synthase-like glutamine amidotransferase